jgi:hypothetical protein
MDLIDEEYTWNDLSSSFFSPLSDFLVNLLSDLWLDFSNISSEKGQESLGSTVNNIDFV